MTFRTSRGTVVIAPEGNSTCELCHKIDEPTRPYGPNGVRVCWDCGNKTPHIMREMTDRFFAGTHPVLNPEAYAQSIKGKGLYD